MERETYQANLAAFRNQYGGSAPIIERPILGDDGPDQDFGGHYEWIDLITAQRIHERQPVRHIDIGSRLDGFVAHVAAFRDIEVLDVRGAGRELPGVEFRVGDITGEVPYKEICDSLSSLHAVEHMGLGRYGDKLDPDGDVLALENMCRLLKPEGRLYVAVPVGKPRIEYNAHRVYNALEFMQTVTEVGFTVTEVSLVTDKRNFIEFPNLKKACKSWGQHYGCILVDAVKLA